MRVCEGVCEKGTLGGGGGKLLVGGRGGGERRVWIGRSAEWLVRLGVAGSMGMIVRGGDGCEG